MNLYPAIDIMGGRAVRLVEGRPEDATVYGSPLEMARRWQGAGARWLHVVDLDGAFAGHSVNHDAIREIRNQCPAIRIEVGGGLRDDDAVARMLDTGVERVILGTAAVRNPDLLERAVREFGPRIAVGIDARDGEVRLSGWKTDSGVSALELAKRMEESGVELVIYTDISRDGRLEGVNVDATRALLDATGLRVIASGGVSTPDDVIRLRDLEHPRLEGVILGKALYENRIDLAQMVREVKKS
jgi:phosphoribosylformimino-5-aminoimidazole carboxamide ribotide isomerase